MKKVLSLLLSLAMLLGITSGLNLTAYAEIQSGSYGENVTYSLDTSTGTLTISGTGDMNDYDEEVFSPFNHNSVKSVIIDNGVTSIGDWIFYMCYNLTSVTISDSVTRIGNSAFYDCTNLSSITIPNSVTSIGRNAFSNCRSLTKVTIPENVSSIGRAPFSFCTNLINIDVNSNNANYSSLDGVLFNKDKTELIQFPSGNARTSYSIPNSVTGIGANAFYGCKSLTSITIPNSVTSIGDGSFGDCSSLTSIVIPDGVTRIGNGAFAWCTSLYTRSTTITIPDSVTSIGSYIINGTAYYENESNWENGVLYLGNCLIGSKFNEISGNYIIKNGTTTIADYAFSGCSSLTNVEIPNSVKSISAVSFFNCTSLTEINVDLNNENYSSQDGVLFNKNKTKLIQYPIGNARTSYSIPDSVTSIGEDAFEFCTNLTNVTIPGNITSIGDDAFSCCTSLTDVYYAGTVEQWNNISIGDYNDYLTNATIHYTDVPSVDPTPTPTPEPTTKPSSTTTTTQPTTTQPSTSETTTTTTVAPTESTTSATTQSTTEVPTTQLATVPTSAAPVVTTTQPATVATTQATTQATTEATTTTTAVTTTAQTVVATTQKPTTTKAPEKIDKKQKKVNIKKATPAKASATISWAKVKGVKGYEIQLATDKKFKKNVKSKTVNKQKTTKTTVKNLKSKTKYYVRIRTYKVSKGTKVYSTWSKTKTVKTK